jgi:hypothetical protein
MLVRIIGAALEWFVHLNRRYFTAANWGERKLTQGNYGSSRRVGGENFATLIARSSRRTNSGQLEPARAVFKLRRPLRLIIVEARSTVFYFPDCSW